MFGGVLIVDDPIFFHWLRCEMGIYDIPEMKLLVQSRTIDLNRIASYPFPYTLVMSVNSVTEKQVVVHAHTTIHFHNKFPCSCNSVELVSTFGTHFPTFGTQSEDF